MTELRIVSVKEAAGRPHYFVVYGDGGEVARIDVTGMRGLRLVEDIMRAELLDQYKAMVDGKHES